MVNTIIIKKSILNMVNTIVIKKSILNIVNKLNTIVIKKVF